MNCMNSLILEGTVENYGITTEKGKDVGIITLASTRYEKDENGDKVGKVSYFRVKVYGALVSITAKNCTIENDVIIRIVGRIEQDSWLMDGDNEVPGIVIIAEHCEFKKVR